MERIAPQTWQRRIVWLAAGLLLFGGACFFSYRGGCVFDGKQGYGDPVRGQLYESIAGLLLLGELGCFSVAGLVIGARRWLQAVGVAVAVLIFGPVSFYLLFEVGIRATIACKPS